jgi:hypothetical protein
MGAAGIGRDVEIGEGIDLDADRLRHLLQLDPVVTQLQIVPDERPQIPPSREKAVGRDALREIGREQRRIVIALVLAEPAKPPRRAVWFDGEGGDECSLAVGEVADGDDGYDAVNPPDVPVPRRQPIE